MKTPKAPNPDSKKSKFAAPLGGKVRKSLGSAIGKKNSTISLKNAEHALNDIMSDDKSEIKLKNNKNRLSLPAGALRNVSKKNVPSNVQKESPVGASKNNQTNQKSVGISPKASKKRKGKANAGSPKSNENSPGELSSEIKQKKKSKITPSGKTGSPLENNSSPVKQNNDTKNVTNSLAFNLSSDALTPKNQVSKKKKGKGSPSKSENSSPEIELGLKLEEALSPKSKKNKKKSLMKEKLQGGGKIDVPKTDSPNKASSQPSPDGEQSGKRKKRRRGKSKSQKKEEVVHAPFFQSVNIQNALSALRKTLNLSKSKQKALLDEDNYVYLQVNLLKGSEQAKGVLHIPLPHLILPDTLDVCLITPDLKGKRSEPDEAIDFYKDVLKKNKIDFVSEVIPIRKLKKEYSQFEERSKLANRFDAILVEGRINKMARIGRRFARTKKCVSAVKLETNNLKNEFEKALRKVALFSSGNGNSFVVKCGRIEMTDENICENMAAIGKALVNDKIIVGDKKNISSVYVKTATSKSFPVYVSTVSPNEVPEPQGKKRVAEKPVKGEVTTVEGGDVVVYPSGLVKVKKRKNEEVESEEEDSKLVKKSKVAQTKNNKKTKGKLSEESEETDDSSSVASITDSLLDKLEDIPSDEIDSDDDEEIDSDAEYESGDSQVSDSEGTEDEEGDDDGGSESDAEDSDDYEAEIEAVEEEYLQEIKKLTGGASKKKKGQPIKSNEKQTIPIQKNKTSKANAAEKKPKQAEIKAVNGIDKAVDKKTKKTPAKNAGQKSPNNIPAGQKKAGQKSPNNSPAGQKKKRNRTRRNKNSPGAQNSPKPQQNKNAAAPKGQAFNKKAKQAVKAKGKGKSQ